jgi:hypothetical protein
MRCATTAIAALVPRQRSRVAGKVESVVSYERLWIRTDAVLVDWTGALVLRFHGRAGVPGMAAGARVVAEERRRSSVASLSCAIPLYSFAAAGRSPATSWYPTPGTVLSSRPSSSLIFLRSRCVYTRT